jgi:DNA polymerase-1
MSNVLLIDTMSEVFRAFHALPKTIVARDGVLINALLGFHNSLRRLVTDSKPLLCASAWSCTGPTFRHELFPQYKGNRSLPEALATQKPLIAAYLSWLGIPQFSCDRFEADDVLATLATYHAARGSDVLIDTVDKDLWSLCADSINVWSPRTKTVIAPVDVMKRFKVQPPQLPDLLALTGDQVDGVPRIPGISDRQAVTLIEQYGSVRSILDEHLDQLPEPQRARVGQNRELLELNLQLTKLCDSVPLDLGGPMPCGRNLCDALEEVSAFLKIKDTSFLVGHVVNRHLEVAAEGEHSE